MLSVEASFHFLVLLLQLQNHLRDGCADCSKWRWDCFEFNLLRVECNLWRLDCFECTLLRLDCVECNLLRLDCVECNLWRLDFIECKPIGRCLQSSLNERSVGAVSSLNLQCLIRKVKLRECTKATKQLTHQSAKLVQASSLCVPYQIFCGFIDLIVETRVNPGSTFSHI